MCRIRSRGRRLARPSRRPLLLAKERRAAWRYRSTSRQNFSTLSQQKADGRTQLGGGEKLHGSGCAVQHPGDFVLPDDGQRAGDAVLAVIIDAVDPALPSRVLGISPQDVPTNFEDPRRHGFAVLRQEQDRAVSLANLGDETGKGPGVRQVDAGGGLAGVAVASGDEGP